MIQKQLIISCCLLCFMASVQAQESVSSGTVITLQGTPLQMDEYTGTDFTTLILSRKIFFYDNTAMKEELYSPDGTVHTKIAYIYSEQGLLSEIRGTDAAGTPKWKYTYEYNEEGQLTTETSWNGLGQTEWVIYTDYTDNGLPAIQRTANPDGTVTLKKDFAYNESGRKTGETTTYGDGKLLKRVTFEHNPDGTVSREFRYDSNGLYETVVYRYENGQPAAISKYSTDGILKDTQHKYYTDGNIIESVTENPDGTVTAREQFIWDINGNLFFKRDTTGITIRDITYGEN